MSKGDIVLAMLICSLYLQDVPMGFREKVILCVLIMKYLDSCMQLDSLIQTESDLIWVNKQIKKMESEMKNEQVNRLEQLPAVEQVALCGSCTSERDWTSDE